MRAFRSFLCAFQGIGVGIRQERHVRIHLTAGVYAVLLSLFFSFSPTDYAVLFLVIGVVIALELVNTAIERVADEISKEYRPTIKVIKDTAAGAVLVAAIAALAIAAALFWEPSGWERLAAFFAGQPYLLVIPASLLVGGALFVFGGGTSNRRK